MSVNKVILLGYVGQDPALRYPEKEKPLAFLSLATTQKVEGQTQEITEWHNVVMLGRDAELAERYIRKGTRLYVEGHLMTRQYTDRMKILRKRTEIIVEKFEILGRSAENS